VLPPLPPDLLEHGGSEAPEKEQMLGERLRAEQEQWTANAKQSAEDSLEQALVLLVDHGIASHNVSTAFSTTIHQPDVSSEILKAAQAWGCGTVVIGRHDLPWTKELLYRHVGDEVVQSAKDLAVTIVTSS
jgi:nucleotide-binding universal stress UspA family protein